MGYTLLYTGMALVLIYTMIRALEIQKNFSSSIGWIRREQKKFYNNFPSSQLNDLPKIILLLPVLREQRELSGLMRHILLSSYPSEKIDVVVITTERECVEQKTATNIHEVTTIEIAEKLVNELNANLPRKRFFHVHCPDHTGNKATQLNFAINEFRNLCPSLTEEHTYIGVYDADSRPDPSTFSYVGWDASTSLAQQKEMPPAYQQVSLYIKNFAALHNNLESILLKLEGFYQTRWSLGYELPNYLGQSTILLTPPESPLQSLVRSRLCYLIGHGCFIRLDTLRCVGGFPVYSPTEDLSLGNILSLLKIPIKPIPFFDICEVPESMRILFNQSKVWFGTSMSIFSTIHYLGKNSFHLDWFRTAYLAIQRTIMHIAWAIGGLLVLLCIVTALFLPQYALFFFTYGVISGISYTTIGMGLTLLSFRALRELVYQKDQFDRAFASLHRRDLVLLLMFSPIKAITNCIGPISYVLHWSLMKLNHVTPTYKKTERIQLNKL